MVVLKSTSGSSFILFCVLSFLQLLSFHLLPLHAAFVWFSLHAAFGPQVCFPLSSPSPLLFLLRSKGPFCPFSFLLSATRVRSKYDTKVNVTNW